MKNLLNYYRTAAGMLHLMIGVALAAGIAIVEPALTPEGIAGAMIINAANLKDLFTGYRTEFQQGFSSLGDDGSIYEKIATVAPSSTSRETYPWLRQLPRMREWLGDRAVHALESMGFTIVNRKFELTEGVPRDAIEDDTYGVYGPVFREFGRSSREHPNELLAEVIEGNPECYDGQNLFDSDHPVLDKDGNETTVSNDMGGSGTAWYVMDLSRAVRPFIFQRRRDYEFRSLTDLESERVFMSDQFLFGVDARVNAGPGLWQLVVRSKKDLTPENYEEAREALKTMRGDYDRPLSLRHTHTMFPGQLEGEAREILMSERNDAGATNKWRGSSEPLENPYLSGS